VGCYRQPSPRILDFSPRRLPANPRRNQQHRLVATRCAPPELINSMELLDNSIPLQPDYQISFRIVEDRNEPIRLRVQDSGEIQAPHIGLVRAAGRTCRDLAFIIKRELEKSYYNKATVIIAIDVIPKVSSSGSSMGPGGVVRGQEYFTVFGQVLRQGKYELPFDEDVSISQAILRAGGPAQFAEPGQGAFDPQNPAR